jgi:hypothetical protein
MRTTIPILGFLILALACRANVGEGVPDTVEATRAVEQQLMRIEGIQAIPFPAAKQYMSHQKFKCASHLHDPMVRGTGRTLPDASHHAST